MIVALLIYGFQSQVVGNGPIAYLVFIAGILTIIGQVIVNLGML